mmetsp:Transcript_29754/g.50258  ORF Transcript_29754/g.50258 Transcript_29754/m.50258 type:complete len:224 (-) Transcript_29754:1149-1820(-)
MHFTKLCSTSSFSATSSAKIRNNVPSPNISQREPVTSSEATLYTNTMYNALPCARNGMSDKARGQVPSERYSSRLNRDEAAAEANTKQAANSDNTEAFLPARSVKIIVPAFSTYAEAHTMAIIQSKGASLKLSIFASLAKPIKAMPEISEIIISKVNMPNKYVEGRIPTVFIISTKPPERSCPALQTAMGQKPFISIIPKSTIQNAEKADISWASKNSSPYGV